MKTIEQILQVYYGCSVPFRLDGSLTSTGEDAYHKLCNLLNDLGNIGIIHDAPESISKLDAIIGKYNMGVI